MVKSIFLQDGEEIFVDDEDYERVSQYTWTKVYSGNTRTIISRIKEVDSSLRNFILEDSFQKDKNNFFCKKNLTIQGNPNKWQKATVNNSSKYKGVSWNKKRKKWHVSIYIDGKTKYLGSYADEDEAGRVYNKAVDDYWGGIGYKNKIGEDNRAFTRPKK